MFLLFFSIICFSGCNQSSNGGKNNTEQKDKEQIEVTLAGDTNVIIGSTKTFKMQKSSKWETVKNNPAITAVTYAQGYELDKWKEDSATGADLVDGYVFETNKTIFAVSKVKPAEINPEDIFEFEGDQEDGLIKRKSSYNKDNLPETLVIPDKLDGKYVKAIAESAFENCTKIKTLDFSRCTQFLYVDGMAFTGCTRLETIKLPSSLKVINPNAFQGCTNLTNVDFSACTALDELSGFDECTKLTTIDLSKCTVLKNIVGSAFAECTALKTVKFPISLEKLENAFTECKELENVDLSICKELKEIGTKTFYNCKKASVKLPKISALTLTKTSFGEITQKGEDKLCKEIQIPEGAEGNALKTLLTNTAQYPENKITTYN